MVDGLQWTKGPAGGWLRELVGLGIRGGRLYSRVDNEADYFASIDSVASKLIRQLAPFSSMQDMLAKIQGGYELSISLLPLKVQMYITDHEAYAAVERPSHIRICHNLLKVPLHTASQVF